MAQWIAVRMAEPAIGWRVLVSVDGMIGATIGWRNGGAWTVMDRETGEFLEADGSESGILVCSWMPLPECDYLND